MEHDDQYADDLGDMHRHDDTGPAAEPIDLAAGEAEALLAASTHLRCIAFWQRRRQVTADVWRAELNRLSIAMADELEKIDRRIAWHSQPVEQLMEALWAVDNGRKTINLPGGQMLARLGRPQFAVTDEAEFVAWNDLHEETFVRRKATPALDEIRKGLQVGPECLDDPGAHSVVHPVTGEIVPGLIARPAQTTFTAKPDPTAGDL